MITDLQTIAELHIEREEENRNFKAHLQTLDEEWLDAEIQRINSEVEPQIDCTACGQCCNTLMINVIPEEVTRLALRLNLSEDEVKERYIETSLQGNMIMNTIPCTFLCDRKCTIYEDRFHECREFPMLNRSGANGRLFSTFMHYGRCPIVFNVIEKLKESC